VMVRGGQTASGAGGAVHILGQDSLTGGNSAAGGMVMIRSGGSTGIAGDITLLSGYSSTATSGEVDIRSGEGLGTASSGAVKLNSGDACDGNTGSVVIATGDAKVGASGSISMTVGKATEAGGDVTLSAGTTTGAGYNGGLVSILSGSGGASASTTGGDGGSLTISAGKGAAGMDAASGGNGGDVTIDAGTGGTGGTSGMVYIGLSSEGVEIGHRDDTKTVNIHGKMVVASLQVGGTSGAAVSKHESIVSSTIDPPELSPTQTWFQDLAFPNANLGDILVVSFSKSIGSCLISAQVININTVRIVLFNTGGGGVSFDPEAGVFRVSIWQYAP